MTDDDCFGSSDLPERIRAYLESHPKQMDSLTGIVNWWWEFERYRETHAKVEGALAELVRAGVLRERKAGGETLYSLNRKDESAD